MTTALIFAALSMGLLGSPHCLGMCGGIVAAFGISMQGSPAKKTLLILSYHIGRLGSYVALGWVVATFGEHVLAPLLANSVMPKYLLGGALVLAALLMLGVPTLSRLEKAGLGLWNALSPIRSKVLPINNLPKALAAGLLWGFLPCGLVYGALGVALGLAAGGQAGLTATAFMLFFWLGTLPMLLATGTVVTWLKSKIHTFNLRKFSGVVMLISGLAIAFSMPIMQMMHGGHDHAHMHGSHMMHDHGEHDHSQHGHDSHHHMHGESHAHHEHHHHDH
ncbi:sulfite exporter TauE/SafE family protein [Moraxella sp. ZJ142]|uniref:sulfite exporter TauE/SafE family protein n=1 Tax=Moraxella marmotae TaxID=3344520 RepID=UPI0035D3EE8C